MPLLMREVSPFLRARAPRFVLCPVIFRRCDRGRLYAYDVTVWQPRQLPASPGSATGAGAVRNCIALAADKTEGRVWTGHSDGTVSVRRDSRLPPAAAELNATLSTVLDCSCLAGWHSRNAITTNVRYHTH